jgi:hypothetical protein
MEEDFRGRPVVIVEGKCYVITGISQAWNGMRRQLPTWYVAYRLEGNDGSLGELRYTGPTARPGTVDGAIWGAARELLMGHLATPSP